MTSEKRTLNEVTDEEEEVFAHKNKVKDSLSRGLL